MKLARHYGSDHRAFRKMLTNCPRNERSANRDDNEALASVFTNLCNAQLAKASLTGTSLWRTSRSVAESPAKNRFLSQRLRCSCHAFKDLAEAFYYVAPYLTRQANSPPDRSQHSRDTTFLVITSYLPARSIEQLQGKRTKARGILIRLGIGLRCRFLALSFVLESFARDTHYGSYYFLHQSPALAGAF